MKLHADARAVGEGLIGVGAGGRRKEPRAARQLEAFPCH